MLLYPYIISSADTATVNHARKYPYHGHDAFSYLLADCATALALLANLGDLEENVLSNGDFCAYRQRDELYPLRSEVFIKIARTHLEAQPSHLFDTLHPEEADLPMDTAVSMRIALKPVVFLRNTFVHRRLPDALFSHSQTAIILAIYE
jgi:hypothetical protein